MQSFARACPTSMIESLLIFPLSGHSIRLQRCSVAADIVYIFEGLSRNELRHFSYVRPGSTLHFTRYIIIPILIETIN